MKTPKRVVITGTVALTTLISFSCKDGNTKEPAIPTSNEMYKEDINDGNRDENNAQESNATAIVNEYLSIKDALVADDSERAAEAGGKLVAVLDKFDVLSYSGQEQNDLKDIVVDAKEQAEQISDSPMEKQRERFKALSKNVTDMVAITGSDQKLYEQSCPMYDKGSAWLSASSQVKNPYYGSEMLNCGKVQREID